LIERDYGPILQEWITRPRTANYGEAERQIDTLIATKKGTEPMPNDKNKEVSFAMSFSTYAHQRAAEVNPNWTEAWLSAHIESALGCKVPAWTGTLDEAKQRLDADFAAWTPSVPHPTDLDLLLGHDKDGNPVSPFDETLKAFDPWLTKTLAEAKVDGKFAQTVHSRVCSSLKEDATLEAMQNETLRILAEFTPPPFDKDTVIAFLNAHRDPKAKRTLDALEWKLEHRIDKLGEAGLPLYEIGLILDEHDAAKKAQEPPMDDSAAATTNEPPAGHQPPSVSEKQASSEQGVKVTDTPRSGNPFQPASFNGGFLRMALAGPSGSGKTYTALKIATALVPNAKVAVIDTERGSARKFSRLFNFDVVELRNYHPDSYTEMVKQAVKYGYNVLVVDSLSHAWSAEGGVLDLVNKKGGGFDKWKDVNPVLWRLVNTILDAQIHVIVTMRVKMEYVQQEVEGKGGYKKTQYVKVGLAPVMKDDIQYEFDVFGEIDIDSTMHISKSRCPELHNQDYPKAGAEVAAILSKWLAG
jgi:hypothetical protein